MEWLFGRRMTPDEMLRKNQRALTKAMRELDRERAKMEQQEKKIIADIKKMAKAGQMDAVKIMAKVSPLKCINIVFLSFISFVITF
jgi:charged multivesicular body protein 2A